MRSVGGNDRKINSRLRSPGSTSPAVAVGLAAADLEMLHGLMECRPQCGACCIAPSISSPIPGMPHGKPAGIPCVQLLPDYRCALYGRPERPAVCASLRPTEEMCGDRREHALHYLTLLELATRSPTPQRSTDPACGSPP